MKAAVIPDSGEGYDLLVCHLTHAALWPTLSPTVETLPEEASSSCELLHQNGKVGEERTDSAASCFTENALDNLFY